MHTFFINTSDSISSDQFQDVLFEKMIRSKELIIPDDCIPFDKLYECAQNMAAIIDQEADITESTSLIVFIEHKEKLDGSPETIRPQSFADETLLSIKAESVLLGTLWEKGKHPEKLDIIFGEHVVRPNFLAFDSVFLEDMQKRMWDKIQLPSCDTVIDFLYGNGEENHSKHEITQDTIEKLLSQDIKGDFIISSKDDDCYPYIIQGTAEDIMYQFEHSNIRLDTVGLCFCLNNAIDFYVHNILRKQIVGRDPVPVHYSYLPMEIRDSHEIHRSIFRLMMYVYAISYNGNHPGFFDTSLEKSLEQVQESEIGAPYASQIPGIDYKKLEKTLQLHVERCKNSEYAPAVPPEDLNEKVKREDKLIFSDHEVPQLIPDDLFDSQQQIVPSRFASYIPDKLKKVPMRLTSLRKAVDQTFESILEKNATNNDEIIRYLNKVTSEYNRIKDDALRAIPFTERAASFMEAGGKDAEKKIDDLKNMEIQLKNELDNKEQRLLLAPQEPVTAKDITNSVEEARKQTDYYFEAFHRGLRLMISCVLFVLAILIPYGIIMKHLFTVPEGYLFFIITGAVSIAALLIGYEAFSRIYRHKIINLVREVRFDFAYSQKNNQECLEQYKEYLYKLVPGYYAEKQYEKILHKYKEQTECRKEQITYHERSRNDRIRHIRNLLDNLDYHDEFQFLEEETVLIINPETDRISNEAVYILSAEEVNGIQIRGKEQDNE